MPASLVMMVSGIPICRYRSAGSNGVSTCSGNTARSPRRADAFPGSGPVGENARQASTTRIANSSAPSTAATSSRRERLNRRCAASPCPSGATGTACSSCASLVERSSTAAVSGPSSVTATASRYPRLATVSISGCPDGCEPSVRLSTEMLRVRLFSSTNVSGQTSCIRTSLSTTRPPSRASTPSVLTAFGVRCTICPSRNSTP